MAAGPGKLDPRAWLLLGGDLRPDPLLLLPELRRKLRPEVLGLEHLAQLDLAFALVRVGRTLDPLDGLFLGPDLQQPEARDQLLGLGERPVHYRPLLARELDSGSLRAGVQALARQHHPRLDQLLV